MQNEFRGIISVILFILTQGKALTDAASVTLEDSRHDGLMASWQLYWCIMCEMSKFFIKVFTFSETTTRCLLAIAAEDHEMSWDFDVLRLNRDRASHWNDLTGRPNE